MLVSSAMVTALALVDVNDSADEPQAIVAVPTGL